MKLYDSVGPNPRVVRIAMAEKGMTIDTVTVDLMGGENRRGDYKARVPIGTLPALELDDGRIITEVTAIVDYLEELQPSPPVIGATPADRAETRMWVRRTDLMVFEPMSNGFRASEGRGLFESRITLVSPEAAAELKSLAQEKLLWLDGQLQGRTWVCGERFTFADIMLMAFLEFGAQIGQPMPAAATWLPGFLERAAARPSAKA